VLGLCGIGDDRGCGRRGEKEMKADSDGREKRLRDVKETVSRIPSEK
jgi:hypothetical protein